jgi:prephenate dehydratase
MVLLGVKLKDIKHIESHPIAIRQCEEFLSELEGVRITEGSDTAATAKMIAERKLTDTAAIAGTLAAEIYGLEILEKRIETNKKNATRSSYYRMKLSNIRMPIKHHYHSKQEIQ